MLRGDVLLQGGLGVAHPPAVGTGEGLGLLHREVVPSVIQVWDEREGGTQPLGFITPAHVKYRCRRDTGCGLTSHIAGEMWHTWSLLFELHQFFSLCVHGLAEGSTVIVVLFWGRIVFSPFS